MTKVRDCDHSSEGGKAHSVWGVRGPIPTEKLEVHDSRDPSTKCAVSIADIGMQRVWTMAGEKWQGTIAVNRKAPALANETACLYPGIPA